MKRWLARSRDLDRLRQDFGALREEFAQVTQRLGESRQELEQARDLIDKLRDHQDEAERRMRGLDDRLRSAQVEHEDEREKLGVAIRKVQGFVDIQGEQLDRVAKGLLERIEAVRAPSGKNDAAVEVGAAGVSNSV